ncbi:carbohydrate-binding protein SusD [Chryseobacterium piperi]|uniref:Carbohydrate-binding protein SusD n=1 Tax=Chryseobacterium piperi TaxID=558152 RepID=A0A086B7S7_9FLAO|nr:RagB/SusD family nutrient uptake outer membrane protein [Chryseobacterium piperi]ASW74081.1 RagB/SusD family nutrient uptake outer membrane protein [Chryseobacterium piperi]KFF24991.1 carbohydrate-binding protein SusD [Chryseobacterium piperi]
MKKIKIYSLLAVGLLFASCTNDLETQPKFDLTLEELLIRDPNAMEGLLSRMYSTFALSSVSGPGDSDIAGANAGESPFIRGLVNLNDFTADGMKNRWGDNGLDQLTTTTGWNSNNKFFKYVYDRIYYTIPQTTNLILILKNKVEVPNEDQYISELRFLRALSYYYLIDFFGKGPLVNDDTFETLTPLPEASRIELFNFVESELKDIEAKIAPSNTYGRANQAVVEMLLAKLYLNAEVYTGTARYNDAATYAAKVIASGKYQLESNFIKNFRADNNTSKEIIFPLIADATSSQSFGNTTYIVNGNLNSTTMNLATYGATEGWGGHRATKAWYGLFGSSAAELASTSDTRARLFWTTGHNYEMTDYKEWTDGYPSIKYTNRNTDGTGNVTAFSSTDFPLFRLADTYLIYAECALRGASTATIPQGLTYVNLIRSRANANPLSNISLQNILDERGRELGLEGVRRQDLIRYGRFTGATYLWPWKGGVLNGTSISANYNVFPIPVSALQANPNLKQNPGY